MKCKTKSKRHILAAFSAFLLTLGTYSHLSVASPIPARLAELLASEAGLNLLSETRAGTALTERLIGKKLNSAADLAELQARLERPDIDSFKSDLQARLEQAESELETQSQAQQEAGRFAASDHARLLEELSARFLEIRTAGAIEFVGGAEGADFASSSRALVGGDASGDGLPGIGVEPGSMEARLGHKLYDQLEGIEERFMRQNGLNSARTIAKAARGTGVDGEVTLKDMLDYVVEQRKLMSEELSKLALQYRASDPLLAETIEKAAHEAALSNSSMSKIQERAVDLSAQIYDENAPADLIMDYVHKLRGEMGELKVAIRVKGLVGRGLMIEDLGRFFGKGAVAEAARARLVALKPMHPSELGKELDLIMDDGMMWGEVKNYSEVFGHEHRFYTKVMEQARHTVEIRDLLQKDPAIAAALKALGKSIHFRIYLLGGVTEHAARELEAMGFEVFGARYPDLEMPAAA